MRSSKGQVRKVERFVEKPDQKTAEKYLSHGGYLWNSGMFVWKAGVILEEIKAYLPDLYRQLKKMKTDAIDPAAWKTIKGISVDYGILEKSRRVMVIPARDLGWSDLGSWNALSD